MIGVLQGFTVIAVIIGVGVLLARTGWLGPGARGVLTKLAFWVATPAMLFTLVSTADLGQLFSAQFVVTAVGMVGMAVLYGVIGVIAKWGTGPTTIGAMTSSYVNSGNLGIPIAAYALGDATLVVPVMLVQQLIMGPVFLSLLDVGTRTGERRVPWWQLVVRPFRNPIVIGSLLGLLVAVTGFHVPDFVMEPIKLIGGITVPAVLLAFGLSLLDNAVPLRGPERGEVLTSTVLKAVVHPLLAWVLGRYAFGLDPATLLAVVVTAALPAAQNIFTYASEYGTGERLSREAILLTTVLSVPVILVITLLLHP